MDESAIGQSRETCGNLHSGSDDTGFGTGSGKFFYVLANERSHRRNGTCKSQTEAVENGFPSQRQDFFRNVLILRIDDELANVLRQPRYIREPTGTFLSRLDRPGRQRRRGNHAERTRKELTP